MPVSSPCKGCSDKCMGCHSDCEKYLSFREELDEYNEAIRKNKDISNGFRESIERNNVYIWRRLNKKGSVRGLR